MARYGTLIYRRAGSSAPQRHQLEEGRTIIGSGKGATIALVESGAAQQLAPEVAPAHAMISCTRQGCYIIDLGSQNGTRLRRAAGGDAPAKRLAPRTAELLHHNDTIEVGGFELRFERLVAWGITPAHTSVPPLHSPVEAREQVRRIPPADYEITIQPRKDAGGPYISRSSYMRYLPPCYHKDPVVDMFLLAFEAVLDPIERTIDEIDGYFWPHSAPEALVPWLATWFGVALPPHWNPFQHRRLLGQAVALHGLRGTAEGLCRTVALHAEAEAQLAATLDTPLDVSVRLVDHQHDPSLESHQFKLELSLPNEHSWSDEQRAQICEWLLAVVRAEKPIQSECVGIACVATGAAAP